MRLEKKFGELTPGDHFFHNDVEWVVLDNKLEDELRRKDTICNAITVDGSAKTYLEDNVIVKASRIKVHILDLRQGDQVTMDRNIDIAYSVSTVLKVWDIIERWNINPHPAYRLGWASKPSKLKRTPSGSGPTATKTTSRRLPSKASTLPTWRSTTMISKPTGMARPRRHLLLTRQLSFTGDQTT